MIVNNVPLTHFFNLPPNASITALPRCRAAERRQGECTGPYGLEGVWADDGDVLLAIIAIITPQKVTMFLCCYMNRDPASKGGAEDFINSVKTATSKKGYH